MKRILLAASLLSALACSSSFAQTSGSLLFPQSNDATLLNWGSDTVNAFLAMHQIPASEWTVIQQYGRQDVRDSLRSFAWLQMQRMIAQSDPLTGDEQYVLQRFADDAKTLQVAAWQAAVNEKNRYLADKCRWRPDATLAAQAGYDYDGADYCPSIGWSPEQFTGPPTISPPKEMFIAYGQKTGWVDPIASRPGGVISASRITAGGKTLLAVGIASAIALAAALSLALLANGARIFKLIMPFAKAVEEGEKIADMSAGSFGIGVGIALALALILIVITIYAYTENARVEAEYPLLDQQLQSVMAAPALTRSDMARLLSTQGGVQLLYATFLAEFVPTSDVNSRLALPGPNPSSDAQFVVNSSLSPSISFKGWSGETYTMKPWHGWLETTSDKPAPGVDNPSINTRFRYQWNGVPYEGVRSGGSFTATKLLTADNDVDCPPSPNTGLSTVSDYRKCRSFTTNALPMDLTTGTRTVSLFASPQLDNPRTFFIQPWAEVFAVGQPRSLKITATGIPTPDVSGPSSLPAGFRWYVTNPGSATLEWDGTGSPGTTSLTFKATGGGSTDTAALQAEVVQAVKFTQPGTTSVTLNLTAGTRYSIPITAVGSPDPGLRFDPVSALRNAPDGCGLSIPGPNWTSGGSFTMQGIAKPPSDSTKTSCTVVVDASNVPSALYQPGLITNDQLTITINVAQTGLPAGPDHDHRHRSDSADQPNHGPDHWRLRSRPDQPHAGTERSAGAQLGIAERQRRWHRHAHHDTSRPGAPDSVLVPLWYRVANTAGNLATSTSDGVLVTVNKKPVFFDVPHAGYIYVASTAGFINQDTQFNLINYNGTLTAADPLPLALSYYPQTSIMNVQGIARKPGLLSTTLIAANSAGTTTEPMQIVSLQPANITSAAKVNFYIGQTTTFRLTASGFPQSPLASIPAGMADPLRFWGTPSDSGIQLQTSDPASNSPLLRLCAAHRGSATRLWRLPVHRVRADGQQYGHLSGGPAEFPIGGHAARRRQRRWIGELLRRHLHHLALPAAGRHGELRLQRRLQPRRRDRREGSHFDVGLSPERNPLPLSSAAADSQRKTE